MTRDTDRRRGFGKLIVAVAIIACIWLVVLPWLARREATAQYLESLDRQGIDPGAMYYTDLPMMERLLDRLER